MKSILLTSTALVAFAGAAAADGHAPTITFGGEASVEYNTDTDVVTTTTEMTATMSKALDNGLTASASITVDAVAGSISYGSIALTSDSASLTFGTELDGAVFTATGDDYAIGAGEEGVANNDDSLTPPESGEVGVVGTYSTGSVDLTVSADVVGSAGVEVGVSTNLGGWDVGFGVTQDGDYAAVASGTVGGAALNFGMSSNDEWDAGVSYTISPITLSASTDEADAWTVGADYDGGAFSAGIEYNADESWEVTAGYAEGPLAIDAALDSAETLTIGATYDVGSGLTVGGGMEGDDMYAFANYDLGGGASAYVEYADAAANLEEVGPSERDIAVGTTVGVSFEF